MKNLLDPKWLFFINTLPTVLLSFIFLGEYNIISTLLPKDSIMLWGIFGAVLLLLVLLNFLFALYLVSSKRKVPLLYGIIALLVYIPFLYLFMMHSDEIIPVSIPQWMVSGNVILYMGTFLMPTLAYSLFVLVVHVTPDSRAHKAWKNGLFALSVPIAWYLFSQLILPFWKQVDNGFGIHVLIIFVIVGTLLFLFFVVRSVFILVSKKASAWQKYQFVWKIPIAILLPITGLFVNNGQLFNDFHFNHSGVFGDFNGYWFYALAILNGLFICAPNLAHKGYRMLLFSARAVTFAYSFYFFMVFLPFLPLSIIAIAAVGTGFLMLSPLMLFVLHIHALSQDFSFLKNDLTPRVLWGLSVAGFLVIPLCISISFVRHRLVLNEALDYIYQPDYAKSYRINATSLRQTLEKVKRNKDRNQDFVFGSQIPYLTPYFNWVVLDNLTLSEDKINLMEDVFFGKHSSVMIQELIENDKPAITDISPSSTYDSAQQAWLSWVDLEITNRATNGGLAEYSTIFELPEGAWISDYYLNIGGKREKGILAEKKTAMWVFSNIRNENRDPGILHYLTGNKVAFRVFPFAAGEVRKTGIQVLHKGPINLKIDSNTIALGRDIETPAAVAPSKTAVLYVTAREKQGLKQVFRKPYFHFLVDASEGQGKLLADYSLRINRCLHNNKAMKANAKISFVNTYVTSQPFTPDWTRNFAQQHFDGGFFLGRAIKSTLYEAHESHSDSYPVMVAVTNQFENALVDKDFSDFKSAFPESDLYYVLNGNDAMEAHSLSGNPLSKSDKSDTISFSHPVLDYPLVNQHVYLPNNLQPSLIFKDDFIDVDEKQIREKDWNAASMLQAKWNEQVWHPNVSDGQWVNLVRYSFMAKVMTPVTSYLVVENDAQKAILKRKQAQVLSGKKSLDLGEAPQRMSEPGLWIVGLLLTVILWRHNRRLHKPTKPVGQKTKSLVNENQFMQNG